MCTPEKSSGRKAGALQCADREGETMSRESSSYRENGPVSERDSEERAKERKARYRQRRRSIFLMRLMVIIASFLIIAIAAYVITSAITGEAPDFSNAVERVQNVLHLGAGTQATDPQAGSVQAPATADDSSVIVAEPQPDAAQGSQDQASGDTQTADNAAENAPADGAAQAQIQPETAAAAQQAPAADTQAVLDRAGAMAACYDYDGAIAALQEVPGYETNTAVSGAIAEYTAAKEACVAADVTTVPHIFYHSLLNDTDRAFNVQVLGQFAVDGMNAWMTTVDEFDRITQKLYDAGYVYVRLRDLVVETVNADGTVHFEPNTSLMLPPGKKPIVLSVDDLSYYHSYKAAGFPEKLVLDENGAVKCQYTDAAGNTTLGDYDVVPRLNTFIAAHPDACYRGARGLIAMTGYNGVFGYRTDKDYELREHLMEDQAAWLAEHPDFNRQTEIAEATKVAEAIKRDGWEFASHTWGHLSVTGKSADALRVDNEKWVENVGNIVGPVDTIIFAHGNDIGSWEGYSADNEQYAYYNSAGYHFYCNVDGSVPYWVQITSDYVRQGRIDLDGYMLYQASTGQTTVLDNMFAASEVFDQRRPTPVVANGQA